MATGHIQLPIGAATLPDGSSGNAAPAILRVQGTETNPKKHFLAAAFDAATAEYLWFAFEMPSDYSSSPTVDLLWYTSVTTAGATCVWACSMGAITEADADTPVEHANAAASTASEDANTTEAGRLISTTVTLSNVDSVAAGDLVFLAVYRDAANGSDDLAVDATLVSIQFKYTTT